MVRQGVGLPRGSIAGQGENRALSDEMHGGCVLVKIVEDRRKRRARVELLRGRGIPGVHVNDEVRIWGKERHLTFGVTTIGAVGVGLDELPDRKAVRGFAGGDRDVLAHKLVSLFVSLPRDRTLTLVPGKNLGWDMILPLGSP